MRSKKKHKNIFSTFDLKPSLEIDEEKLDKKYAELISQNHPDKFINKPLKSRQSAEAKTAQINEAYRTLSSPKAICQYMIDQMMEGQQASEEEKIFDDDYMSETMMLHSELHGLRSAKECEHFRTKIINLYDVTFSQVKKGIIDKNLSVAQKHMNKLKFLEKILQHTRNKHFELEMNEIKQKQL